MSAKFAAIIAILITGVTDVCAANARTGQGSMTVAPTIVVAGTTTNYTFNFRGSKTIFDAGSQVSMQIPAGWTAPQTNNSQAAGYIAVSPVQSGSTVSVASITGSGPWTLILNISTTKRQGGFTLSYNAAVSSVTAGVYRFDAQSKTSTGPFKTLRSGSPTVTVNSPIKVNTAVSIVSSLNPSTYGQAVQFDAYVTNSGGTIATGTATFRDGDVIIGVVTLDASGHAKVSTNRFSVPDSPSSITAEYSGNLFLNASISGIFLQNVNPSPASFQGLAATDKVYDGTTVANLDTNLVALAGILPGDDVALDVSGSSAGYADANSGLQKSVAVSGLALGGNDGGNYLISPNASLAANIYPSTLVITANDTNRLFATANPVFTATYSGFVPGEDASVLSGQPDFATTAVLNSPANGSPYPIIVSQGTLSAQNYTFSFVSGQLTVLPAPGGLPTITAIARLADGNILLTCSGSAGQMCLLQAAPEVTFSNNPTNIASITIGSNGTCTSVDTAATNFTARFYRTALP